MPSARVILPLLLLLCGPARADAPLTWLAVGDAPYARGDMHRLATLLEHNRDVDFMVHVGDIKSGRQRCDAAHYTPVVHLFAAQPVPVVYSPGDNDWTDCRRDVAGGYDPTERLSYLRERFYGNPGVLHLGALDIHHGAAPDRAPEVFWFRRDGVLFINWHVVGSYNNRFPRDRAAMNEYRARRAANHAILEAALAALDGSERAVVVLQHANPGLSRDKPHPGYRGMQTDLAALLAATRVPVLLIHGDTHSFRFDQPWLGRANGERLWRLEVPGYPHVGGVRVQLGKDPARPFRITYRNPDDTQP